MSSVTNDWIQNISHNKVRYFVLIDDFLKKMREYSMYEDITSEPFMINKSRFAVNIVPNGDGEEDYVSVFLVNLNDWRVCLKYEFSVPQTTYNNAAEKVLFSSYNNNQESSWGRIKFLPHNQSSKWLTNDSLLKIVVDVELLCEEMQLRNDKALNINSDLQIEKPGSSDEEPKSCGSEMNQELVKEVENLKSMVSKLSSSVEQLTEIVLDQKSDTLRIEWPECPICQERIKKPMRLKQCGKGHIVCEGCLKNETNCYTCKDVISGRPTALEHILSL